MIQSRVTKTSEIQKDVLTETNRHDISMKALQHLGDALWYRKQQQQPHISWRMEGFKICVDSRWQYP